MSDATSEAVWYLARDGQRHGPLNDVEMRLFVEKGHLKPGDLVWKPGFTDWQPAEVVFPKRAVPPPPPKAPAPPPAASAPMAAAPVQPKERPATAQPSPENSPTGTDQQHPTTQPTQPRAGQPGSGSPDRRTGPGAAASSAASSGQGAPSAMDQPGQPHQTDRTGGTAAGQRRVRPTNVRSGTFLGSQTAGEAALGLGPNTTTGAAGSPVSGGPAGTGAQMGAPLGGELRQDRTSPPGQQHDPRRVEPSFGGRPSPGDATAAASGSTAIVGAGADLDDDDEFDDYDEPPRSTGFMGRVAFAVVAIAVIGGAGYTAYENRDTLSTMIEAAADATSQSSQSDPPPLVKAPQETRTAALDESRAPEQPPAPKPAEPEAQQQPSSAPSNDVLTAPGIMVLPPSGGPQGVPNFPPTQPAPAAPAASAPDGGQGNGATPVASTQVTPDVIDENFQKSPLWALMKREFPDWYTARVEEVAAKSSGNEATDVSKYLINELVALRRKHADEALAASTGKLRGVAEAFLANLKNLSTHSTETCYEFISKGETSPTVIELFPRKDFGNTIEAQIAAVFEAVADGRKTPAQRQPAQKPDYDILAQRLGQIGWKQDDLKLFADPKALSQAPRERVCKMVQDWFEAHIGISDEAVQERLLFVTLRPVIAG